MRAHVRSSVDRAEYSRAAIGAAKNMGNIAQPQVAQGKYGGSGCFFAAHVVG